MTYRDAEEHLEELYEARKRDKDDYGRGLATAYWVALETLRRARFSAPVEDGRPNTAALRTYFGPTE